jgi:glycosyltransferase involved in cell wall biosynthesis
MPRFTVPRTAAVDSRARTGRSSADRRSRSGSRGARARIDAVTVTGRVDDVRPYLARGTVFVCPLRSGAGIKNKILQAWSMGKAVVATPGEPGRPDVRGRGVLDACAR